MTFPSHSSRFVEVSLEELMARANRTPGPRITTSSDEYRYDASSVEAEAEMAAWQEIIRNAKRGRGK